MIKTPDPNPGPGFRLLNVGEIIDKDDEFQLSPTQWSKITDPEKYVIGCKWGGAFVPFRRRVTQETEIETLRMQLAACGVAALDGSERQFVKPGSPYYTTAYEDIIRLRRYADSARKVIADVRRHMPWLNLPSFLQHNLDYPPK